MRSDAYQLTDDSRIVLDPSRSAPPTVSLDPRFYKMVDAFEERFPEGPPSMRRCIAFEIEGDVVFGAGVTLEGEVKIRAPGAPSWVPAGASLSGVVKV